MPARLDVYFSDLPIRRFGLEEGREYLLGRDAGCDLTVNDPRISRRHARLVPAGSSWRLVDLGSKNGTWIDGQPAAETGDLPAAAWLSLGGMPARFESVSEDLRRADALRDRQRWQTSLEIARRIDPRTGLDSLLGEILGSVREVSGCERSFVMLSRTDGDLEVAASAGLPDGELSSPGFAGSLSALERTLATGRPVTVVDARVDALLASRPSIVQGGIAGLVCLPLQVLDRLIGVIYADSRRPGSGFTELDVEILSALASHAALAIAVVRLAREVDAVRAALPFSPAGPASGGEALSAAWDRSLPAYRPPVSASPRAGSQAGSLTSAHGASTRQTWTGIRAAAASRLEVGP